MLRVERKPLHSLTYPGKAQRRYYFAMKHWLYIVLGFILGTALLYFTGEFILPRTNLWR